MVSVMVILVVMISLIALLVSYCQYLCPAMEVIFLCRCQLKQMRECCLKLKIVAFLLHILPLQTVQKVLPVRVNGTIICLCDQTL